MMIMKKTVTGENEYSAFKILHNNSFNKHVLATVWGLALLWEHPVQIRLRAVVTEGMGETQCGQDHSL